MAQDKVHWLGLEAGGRWEPDALPYVGLGEAVLPTMVSLGVLLLIDGAG